MNTMREKTTDVVTSIIQEYIARGGRGAQTELARTMDVTIQTVSKWVHGQTNPEQWRWPALEDAMGLERGYIAGRVLPGYDDRVSVLEARVAMLEQLLLAEVPPPSPPRPDTSRDDVEEAQ